MEVILTQDVQGLGYKNDTVKVKPGYGRNYLITRGFAIIASKSNKKMTEENVRQASHKLEKVKMDAMAVAESIGDLTIEIGTKAGESGKIFGSITNTQVTDALKDRGIAIDKRSVIFGSPIKDVGEYDITIDLHKEVKHPIKVKVIAE